MGVKVIVGIAVSVLIACSLLPWVIDISESDIWITTDAESPTGWQYDDYELAADNVSSASGALELVTLAGENYIHANGVGEGVITFSDSTTETVTVKKAVLDFYCFNGQSNSTYRSSSEETDPSTADPYPDRGAGYFINMFASNTVPMPLYDDDGEKNVGGNFPSFMATYNDDTNRKMLLTSAGVGGRSILKFQPEQEMYLRTLTAMNVAYDNYLSNTDYYEPGKKVMIWIQGESDNDNMTADQYQEYFMTFWDGINDDGPFKFDYCMISLLTADYPVITDADKQLIDEYANMYLGSDVAQSFTVDNGMLISDGVHYSQAARNILGASLGEKAVYLLSHQKIEQDESIIQLYSLVPVLVIVMLVSAVAVIVLKRDM